MNVCVFCKSIWIQFNPAPGFFKFVFSGNFFLYTGWYRMKWSINIIWTQHYLDSLVFFLLDEGWWAHESPLWQKNQRGSGNRRRDEAFWNAKQSGCKEAQTYYLPGFHLSCCLNYLQIRLFLCYFFLVFLWWSGNLSISKKKSG